MLVLSLLPLLVSALHPVFESLPGDSPPPGWDLLGPPHPESTVSLHFYLPQPNFAQLEKELYQISDPDHHRYGMHLSKEQVDELVKPKDESLLAVDNWLKEHDIDPETHPGCSRSDAKDVLKLDIPISKAEELLGAKYAYYRHSRTGNTLLRTTSYSLPAHLHSHVDTVQPTTSFSLMRPHGTSFHFEDDSAPSSFLSQMMAAGKTIEANGQTVDASCNSAITVNCLRQLYNAVGVEDGKSKKNEVGVTGYLQQFINFTDYSLFLKNETDAPAGTTFNVVLVNGGINNQSAPGGEAELDTQFLFGLAPRSKATFWSTGGSPPFNPSIGTPTNTNEPYAQWVDFVLSQKKIPQTISTSYGDEEQTVPVKFAKRVCASFAQITARGTTLLFSSGDGGVGDGDPDPETTVCITNDGKNKTEFLPAFPASCPFVTAVGATFLVPEIAVPFSGGGFSNVFDQPSYQKATVNKFLKSLPKGTFKGLFNPNGRAYPDVALQGVNFRIFFRGRQAGISGTSASSPGFGGLIAIINDHRLAKGLPSIGFLNPLLYKTLGPLGFNDITEGNNPGCGTEGFNATVGWDPVTGFGTPNVKKLLKLMGVS